MRHLMEFGLVLFLAGAPMGCVIVRITGEVYERGPDPQEDAFIKVSSVSGGELTLSDGRKFQLLGVDVSELTGEQLKALETRVAIMVVDQPRLVLAEVRGGKAKIEESYYRPLQSGALVVTLFPKRVGVPPVRIDVGQRIIAEGDARTKLDEIDDPKLREWYAASEMRAKTAGLGIWGGSGRGDD